MFGRSIGGKDNKVGNRSEIEKNKKQKSKLRVGDSYVESLHIAKENKRRK